MFKTVIEIRQNESLLQTFVGAKVFADFRGKSLQTLEVITIQTLVESLKIHSL